MAISDLVTAMKSDFKEQYDYLQDNEVDGLYDKALSLYLDLAFPFDHDIIAIPETRARAVGWVRDCMIEILDRNGYGIGSAKSYSENGLSISFDSSCLSNTLKSRIMPTAGTFERVNPYAFSENEEDEE